MTERIYRREIADFVRGMSCRLDDNALPVTVARRAYNFDARSGALVDGVGVGELPVEPAVPRLDGVDAVWHYRLTVGTESRDKLVAYDGRYLYAYDLTQGDGAWHLLADSAFSSRPVAINYNLNSRDCIILCSGTDDMLVWDGEQPPYRVTGAPNFVSVCVHYERMWAVAEGERDCVWFSSELDPTAWSLSLDGAGFISMRDERGKMLGIVSFLDYLYVFREYGITRISAYAEQTQFGVSHLFTSSGRIYGDTVQVCGDRIVFCASDGVYVFDGLSTTRVLEQLSPALDATHGRAAYFDGCYYLQASYDFGDGGPQDAVLVYGVTTGETLFLRGAGITYLARVTGTTHAFLAVVANGRLGSLTQDGKVFGSPTRKLWESPYTDLGRPDRAKNLRELHLVTHTPLTLTVTGDGKARIYELKGSPCVQRIRLRGRARLVSFALEAQTQGVYVSHPVLTYSI